MWLITAIGSVHGQQQFTFALEQKRTYTVGRDKTADIRFESRYVRLQEGTLVVGDWDPTQRLKPPELRWKVEPKKKGANNPFKTLTPIDESDAGSTTRDHYEVHEQDAAQGCFLEATGAQGIELAADAWFIAVWEDLQLQYDKMKDETEDVRSTLRNFCVSHTAAFDTEQLPNYVLSPAYKSNSDCNYAVCFGVRILAPPFLQALLGRLASCWKKQADHVDSWSLPNEEAPEFQPELDKTLPKSRLDVAYWLPDPRRRTLFQGWRILGLKTEKMPMEKRYLVAMGADYEDIDVVSRPLMSSDDFKTRMSQWLERVDNDGKRDSAIVVYFANVKEGLSKKNVAWNSVVAVTCQRLGLILASGAICWGATKFGDIRAYLEDASVRAGAGTTATATSAVPPARVTPIEAPPTQRESDPSQTPVIPSTFPEETDGGPSTGVKSSPVKPKSLEKVAVAAPIPEVEPAGPSTVRKPLKRRAGRAPTQATYSAFAEIEEDLPQPDVVMDSQPNEASVQIPPAAQQHIEVDTAPVTLTQTQSQAPRSRLKRRAGGAPQPASLFSLAFEGDLTPIKDEETPVEIRELYEQTKRETGAPAAKRARVVSAESGPSGGRSRESSLGVGRAGSVQPSEGLMDVEEEVEEDFVQRTLRRAAKAKKEGKTQTTQATQPAQVQASRAHPRATRQTTVPSEDEEEEEEEEVPVPSKSKKPKSSQPALRPKVSSSSQTVRSTQGEVTRDEAFLQAITKASKSKKAIDELDKEFNQLRIPKPGGAGGTKVVKSNEWEAGHPDYTVLNDFDDEMRGNFIQIVRKDLFRKDGGRKEAMAGDEQDQSGKPNFKKFKKKQIARREPLSLVLVGRALEDAEMGEPFWPAETQRGRKTQASQALDGGDEDSMPLLPRSKRRLLDQRTTTEDGDDQDGEMPPPTAKRRGGAFVQDTPTQSQASEPKTTGKTRGESVVSDISSVGGGGSTRSKRASAAMTTGRTARGGRGTQRQPVLLEDSEEEGVEFTPSAVGSASGSGGTRPKGRSTRGAQDHGEIDTATTRSSARTTSQMGPPQTTGSASVTMGRKKLLPVDDDDDDMVFKVLAKRRRLG